MGTARTCARSGSASSASDFTSISSATFALMRADTAAWTVGSLASGSTVATYRSVSSSRLRVQMVSTDTGSRSEPTMSNAIAMKDRRR